jgi:hypothetical protein
VSLRVLGSTFGNPAQRDAVTHEPHSTIQVSTAVGIIDPIAVADIEATPAEILPDRVLDEPGKGLWKAWMSNFEQNWFRFPLSLRARAHLANAHCSRQLAVACASLG